MLAFGTRVPVPIKGRKSAPGDIHSPSKETSSLPPERDGPGSPPLASTAVQEPRNEEDVELKRSDAAIEPVQLPPSSKSPSPPPRAESPEAPPEEDAQESGEERPEFEITPPEEDDATGRWRDEVTMASDPESAEEVGSELDSASERLLTHYRSISRLNNSLP